MGATHRSFDLEQSVEYVNRVYEDYLEYGRIGSDELIGGKVLELGPGDNLGVALRFAAAGASRVVATDRFVPVRDPAREEAIYRALSDELPGEARSRVAAAAAGERFTIGDAGIELLEETPIEEAPAILGERSFDLIVSRAVLEHVYDLETAVASMDELLRPGGLMVHKVDLSDHGLFSLGGHNPLTFLTVSDRTYRWMGEKSAGLPNRRRIDWYRDELEGMGYMPEFLVTHMAGSETELEPHVPLDEVAGDARSAAVVGEVRQGLNRRWRDLPTDDLAVTGFMLVARKPEVNG